MKLPSMSAGRPAAHTLPALRLTPSTGTASGLAPAGCCAKVCVPLAGCHCVLEAPICP